MITRTEFDDTCEVTCISNDVAELGEILSFREKEFISLTIRRSVKLRLNWDDAVGVYIGRMAGLEFQSDGPTARRYRIGR